MFPRNSSPPTMETPPWVVLMRPRGAPSTRPMSVARAVPWERWRLAGVLKTLGQRPGLFGIASILTPTDKERRLKFKAQSCLTTDCRSGRETSDCFATSVPCALIFQRTASGSWREETVGHLNIYREWGFVENPFSVSPLPPSEIGEKLLIGRSSELAALLRRLATPPNIPTIEGLNGMGKTSLVNVALYTYAKQNVGGQNDPLFLTCRKTFQIRDETDPNEFLGEVLLEVAQLLIKKKDTLIELGYELPRVNEVNRWLNSPEFSTAEVNLASLVGVGFGRSAGGQGFEASGFKATVLGWLENIFHTPDRGGVICILDNLEILRKSVRAREILEEMRDPVLSVPGLRWIMAGALGVVYGIARSPRLQGIISRPIELGPLGDDEAPGKILLSRFAAFAVNPSAAYLPVSEATFRYGYSLMNGNIRNVLGLMNDFCQWCADGHLANCHKSDPDHVFHGWLADEALKAYADARDSVRADAWRLFEDIVREKGTMRLPDFRQLSTQQQSELLSRIRELIGAGLVTDVWLTANEVRKTLFVTAKGWLVDHARNRRAI